MKKRMIQFTTAEKSLLEELYAYEKSGCSICLNGRPSPPGEVVNACFRENGKYMRDLVSDENAVIRKIDFIRIKEKR